MNAVETSRFKETQRQVLENDPPIEVNQEWIAELEDGVIGRRLRIIAPHPDGGWITQDLPSKLIRHPYGFNWSPEFNLRYIFKLAE